MSIIEQAARRLEQLAGSGYSPPWAPLRLWGGVAEDVVGRTAPSTEQTPRPRGEMPMVELNLERLERTGHLVPRGDASPLADALRRLKRALLSRVSEATIGGGRRNALVMVTSALQGEGKTYCSINLAMSIAMEVDLSVLLVDADVLQPALPDRLGIAPARGLLDVLSDASIGLEDVILGTNVPKLSVLPTGTLGPRAHELLGSAAMNRVLADLARGYPDRLVIFDAPPLLVSPVAQLLAGRMGQVVMVVRAGVTPRRSVAQAFAALAECPNVSSLLNMCDARDAGDAGSYAIRPYPPQPPFAVGGP